MQKNLADDLRARIQSVELVLSIRRQRLSVGSKLLISLILGMLISIVFRSFGVVVAIAVAGYWVWLFVDANRDEELRARLVDLKDQLESLEDSE